MRGRGVRRPCRGRSGRRSRVARATIRGTSPIPTRGGCRATALSPRPRGSRRWTRSGVRARRPWGSSFRAVERDRQMSHGSAVSVESATRKRRVGTGGGMATTATSEITFPYKRSLGPVLGAFMTALTEQRLIGIRDGDRVMCPPLEWSPRTGAELPHDFVDVGPAGTVESWGWVPDPTPQHPLDRPFAFASIRLDGADNAFVHIVEVASAEDMSIGMRVVPRWRAERIGHITDIETFVPGEQATAGGADGASEPVTMMDYAASITYTTPVPDSVLRSTAAIAQGKFLGLRCPVCGRTYTGGRGYCPIDAVAMGEQDEVELPHRGVITNFTIVFPVQYPGQTETEPFGRVHVLLD